MKEKEERKHNYTNKKLQGNNFINKVSFLKTLRDYFVDFYANQCNILMKQRK